MRDYDDELDDSEDLDFDPPSGIILHKDQMSEVVAKAIADWFGRNATEKAIRSTVFNLLNSARSDLIAKMLGFDRRWSTAAKDWEVDHCNGRQGESTAGDFLKEAVSGGVQEWLKKQAGDLPDLTPAQVKALRKEYLHELDLRVGRELNNYAQKAVSSCVADVVGEVLGRHGYEVDESTIRARH